MVSALPLILIVTATTSTTSTTSAASRDADIFAGGEAEAPSEATEPFGEPEGGSVIDRLTGVLEDKEDILAIGGQLFVRADHATADEGGVETFPLTSRNLLDVYLDARPTERLRAYARGRLVFTPTSEQDELQAQLDQLWLKLDIERAVFLTLGRQPIKWGSGRFWNPSDFVNAQIRDPLAVFDERLGVTVVKVHAPFEAIGWNLYAIALLEGAGALDQVGGAFRAEALFGQAEVALSALVRKDSPIRLAADVSAGVWEFDLRAEAAVSRNVKSPFFRLDGSSDAADQVSTFSREDEYLFQAVAGAEVAVKYSDEDSLILGGEYFFNQSGYEDTRLYPFLFERGAFTPLYLGKHYAALYALALNPGSWNDTTFILSGLGNLSDRSLLVRLDHRVLVLTHLEISTYAAVHFGRNGELNLSVDIPARGIRIPGPLLDLGLGARVYW